MFRRDIHSSLEYSQQLPKPATGFPSPADDFFEPRLDLNERYVLHKEATFFLRVHGDSMLGAGIHDGDLLIVDRSIEPVSGHIVIAALTGDFMVRRYLRHGDQVLLTAENPRYKPIHISSDQDLLIWGVVTTSIHTVT